MKKKYFIPLLITSILITLSFCTTAFFYNKKHIPSTSKEVPTMKNSKTLDKALESSSFLEKNTTKYQEIDYIDTNQFIEKINKLLDLEYSTHEINNIFKYINEKNIEKMLTMEKINVYNYYQVPNFEVDKISRYEKYQNIHNCSIEEAVIKVNIGLDHDFYTQIELSENVDEYTVLVNKYHSLENYEPSDLVSLSYSSNYKLREKAAEAFEKLVSAAKLDNVYIRPYSAYRSYETQKRIYNNYVKKDGQMLADTYSARPGHSEHQTGFAVDVWSEGYNEIRPNDANWLKENAPNFGFIIRYTEENMPITGYIEEPWHLRYLGEDIAKDVTEKNITYDEYYDLYIK